MQAFKRKVPLNTNGSNPQPFHGSSGARLYVNHIFNMKHVAYGQIMYIIGQEIWLSSDLDQGDI